MTLCFTLVHASRRFGVFAWRTREFPGLVRDTGKR
jgi:hypothetical protein